MGTPSDPADPYDSAAWLPPDELVEQVNAIRPLWPEEKRTVWRDTAGLMLDRILVQLARGRGALEVAIGELLASLGEGDRLLRLGFSNVGDYGRERLNLSSRSTQVLTKLARDLRTRPLLEAAVRRGTVSRRKAQTIVEVAHGEAEAEWVELATRETVRALAERVRATRPDGGRAADDEAYTQLRVRLTAEENRIVNDALELAGRMLGPRSSTVQRIEVICQEYLGDFPGPYEADDVRAEVHHKQRVLAERVRRELEEDHHRWRVLVPPEPRPAPATKPSSDPFELDEQLTRLAGALAAWDELLGRAAHAMRDLGLWRDAGFASFAHYCGERLGLGVTTVGQRITLDRALYSLPELRTAMHQGRIGYEKARFIARVAKRKDVESWIERAERVSCLALQREVAALEEKQMCARDNVGRRFSVPRRVRNLILAAFASARDRERKSLRDGACLRRIAEHFIAVWTTNFPKTKKTLSQTIRERDGNRCTVPGCSLASDHNHHITFRSRGGSDDPKNLTGACAAHHLIGIHNGSVRVYGTAPDNLTWELGVRPGHPPLMIFRPAPNRNKG